MLGMLGIEPEAATALLKELYFDSIPSTNDSARVHKGPHPLSPGNQGGKAGRARAIRTTHMVTRAHKRRRARAAATSAAATMGEAVRLPAETDTVSPAQTNKRCRNATSGAGPSKRLRFVTNMTSVTMVRTHADGTESTARLDGLPAISKRTREGEDG